MSTRRDWLRRHKGLVGAALVLGVSALVFVLVWFQPQALLFDRVVDEELPVAAVEPPAPEPDPTPDPAAAPETTAPATTAPETPSGPRALATGEFSSRNRYTVTGTATVYDLPEAGRVLRLEDFSSTNGPDLFVYLTAADSSDSDGDLDGDFVDLGVLKGNVGNQNYEIPDAVDLDVYDTVVVWCRRFTVGFGAADLG